MKRPMITFVICYLAVAVILFPLDVLWLAKVATTFYQGHLGPMLRESPHMGAAAAFYLLYVGGIVVFAVMPQLNGGSSLMAALLGAGLGLIAYGTYDVTNYATLKGFPLQVALVDWAWGTVLTGVSAGLGHFIATRFL